MATYTYNGHSYLLSGYGTWQQAQAQAKSLGGNLVTINDQAEQNWLITTFGSVGSLWIGYTDQETEGVFKWISGETSSYTNWYPGQPDNLGGNEDYVHLYFQGGWKWNDLVNSRADIKGGIIEINNVPSVNNPPTGTLEIIGTAQQNQTLSVKSTVADADGLGAFNYQWLSNGNPIYGATYSTYTLTANEVGKNISVKVNYKDWADHPESVTSGATGAVTQKTAVTPTVTLSSNAKTVNEGGSVTYTAMLSSAATTMVSVPYSVRSANVASATLDDFIGLADIPHPVFKI
jgi:hypothetical protein